MSIIEIKNNLRKSINECIKISNKFNANIEIEEMQIGITFLEKSIINAYSLFNICTQREDKLNILRKESNQNLVFYDFSLAKSTVRILYESCLNIYYLLLFKESDINDEREFKKLLWYLHSDLFLYEINKSSNEYHKNINSNKLYNNNIRLDELEKKISEIIKNAKETEYYSTVKNESQYKTAFKKYEKYQRATSWSAFKYRELLIKFKENYNKNSLEDDKTRTKNIISYEYFHHNLFKMTSEHIHTSPTTVNTFINSRKQYERQELTIQSIDVSTIILNAILLNFNLICAKYINNYRNIITKDFFNEIIGGHNMMFIYTPEIILND